MNRILSFLVCIALTVGLLSGCTQEETPYIPTGDALATEGTGGSSSQTPTSQEITLAYNPNQSMNPYDSLDITNRLLFSLLYQGLFAVDRNYQAYPVLCDRFQTSLDMRTHTFYPAQATFSDGSPLTPEDVLASLETAKKSRYYSGRFQHIVSMELVDGAIVIKTDTPCKTVPLLLDIPIVKAEQVYAASPLGTGPYILDNSLSGKQLRRNTQWWCQAELALTAPYVPLIEGTSAQSIRNEFMTGNLGLAQANPCVGTYSDYHCDYELWNCESGVMLYMVVRNDSPVLIDDDVRAALTHAIDRTYLVEKFYRGYAEEATLPASPYSPYYNTKLAAKYEYDPTKLPAALAESNLTGARISILLNSDDSVRLNAGRAIADMLRAGGFTVDVIEEPKGRYEYLAHNGTYDIYLGQTRLSPNMDLSAFFSPNGNMNSYGLANRVTYAYCLEALADSGNFYNLHKSVMDAGYLCPILFHNYAIFANRGLIYDLSPSRDNVFFYTIGRTLEDAQIQN